MPTGSQLIQSIHQIAYATHLFLFNQLKAFDRAHENCLDVIFYRLLLPPDHSQKHWRQECSSDSFLLILHLLPIIPRGTQVPHHTILSFLLHISPGQLQLSDLNDPEESTSKTAWRYSYWTCSACDQFNSISGTRLHVQYFVLMPTHWWSKWVSQMYLS